ncbi:MAG: efflux RND transporter permease subunit [Deltaproteobacteria bacterium]|nr:MAG: efflux RND transporter permease subunit [Deltaproteobacteria bacterium]
MILSDLSVRRPVTIGALVIGLVILGLNAFRGVPLEFMPRVDIPVVNISTVYPGAGPEEIEADILEPLEAAVSTVPGVDKIQSIAIENVGTIILEFDLDVDVDEAAVDVREKLDLARSQLPSAAEDPVIAKVDPSARPIINLALTGSVGVDALYDYADQKLSGRLATIPGVAQVQLIGGADREVHVLVDRARLAAKGLTTPSVVQAVGQGVVNIPAGRVHEGDREFPVKFDAEYDSIGGLGELELVGQAGARVLLRDVASVVMGTDDRREAAFVDGQPAIAVRVVKKSEANIAAVASEVRSRLDELRADLPGGMELVWVTDDGAFAQATVDSALSSIVVGVGLTALILFLFLFNLRSTIIVAISMPVTYVASMLVLRMMDFTLNTVTTLSIGLSVGVLVTNSIVVIERISKRLVQSGDPAEAARLGTGDVAMAVLASAGTNLVVLIPIATMGSLVGMMLAPFATTMIVVTAVSLFISFTLTPMLAAKLLKPAGGTGLLDRLAAVQHRSLEWAGERYTRSLLWLGRHRLVIVGMLVAVVGVLIVSGRLADGAGFTMMSESDQGNLSVKLEYPTGGTLEDTIAKAKAVEARLAQLPHLQRTYTTVGRLDASMGQASQGTELAQILLVFSSKTEREQTIFELSDMARELVGAEPGCRVSIGVPSAMGGNSQSVQLEVAGEDIATLNVLAKRGASAAATRTDLTDVDTSVRPGKTELRVKPRRAVLADVGMPVTTLGQTLRGNLAGLVPGVFRDGSRTYDIRVKLAEEDGRDQVSEFMLPAADGKPVMLASLAAVELDRAPTQILRSGRQRVTKVFANPADGVPLSEAVSTLGGIMAGEAGLPAGYTTRFTGMVEVMNDAMIAFGQAILIALILIYLVLAAILESFVTPLLILLTVPLAFIGILLGLVVAGEAISIFVMLGVVVLIGIVVNNAILIIERQRQLIADEGMSRAEAMAYAAGDQLRPVLMITLAAILGMLPFAIATGLGSEPRIGIGASSIGGIFVSALLTLYVLPAVSMLGRRGKKGAVAADDAALA